MTRKARSTLGHVARYEKDPRWSKFCELLLETHNARKAALAAGYAESTADSRASEMADLALRGIKAELFLAGLTKAKLAKKLLALFDAKEPKWNKKQEKWNYFQNTSAQIEAYDRIKAVVEPEPPKPLVQQFFGINFDQPVSKEQFIERHRQR